MQGFRELGYVEGRNLVIEYPDALGREDRLPELAADLVRKQVDIIRIIGPASLEAARKATNQSPWRWVASSSDPVAEGVALSLARPGGNITGLAYAESDRFKKQLEFLKSATVRATRVAVLWDFALKTYRRYWEVPLADAVRILGLTIQEPVRVRDAQELPAAFALMKNREADAMLVAFGGPLFQARAQVGELALQYRLQSPHSRKCADGTPHELRTRHLRHQSQGCGLRRQNFQRCQIRRLAYRIAEQVRVGDQSQDGQGARAHHPSFSAAACGRSDPMMSRRAFIFVVAGSLLGSARATTPRQSGRTYRIGILSAAAGAQPANVGSFVEAMRELGYVEGQNLTIERRYAGGQLEILPNLAAELVRMPVDVIVVGGPTPVRAAMSATTRIPIVMVVGSSDPVSEGLVKSLAHPGGNLTGSTYAVSPERFGKQLEFLKEAAPGISRIGIWWDIQMTIFHQSWAVPLEAAARKLSLQIQPPVQVLSRDGVEGAFARMKQQRADAVLVVLGGPTVDYYAAVAATAVRNQLPTVATIKAFTTAGGLLSYGPDLPAIYRRAASYVDRILNGASPGDLPIELPTNYELAINLKTAKALALTLPRSLLLRADEVIE
jgi:putative ABC transport system substrate-binding protein